MSDPTEALVRKEVARARKILREDLMLGKLSKAFPDEPEPENPDGPKAPVKTEPKEQPKRKGLWWGEERDA